MTAAEVEKARTQLRARLVFENDSVTNVAHQLGYFETVAGPGYFSRLQACIDAVTLEDIQHVVARLKERGIGVLVTDHNVHETLAITDHAYLLYDGRIFTSGTAEELAADEEVRRKYLGERFTLERYRGA